MHTTDTDCTIDPATDCCAVCGVLHGDPCRDCAGCGYHRPDCPTVLSDAIATADATLRDAERAYAAAPSREAWEAIGAAQAGYSAAAQVQHP